MCVLFNFGQNCCAQEGLIGDPVFWRGGAVTLLVRPCRPLLSPLNVSDTCYKALKPGKEVYGDGVLSEAKPACRCLA